MSREISQTPNIDNSNSPSTVTENEDPKKPPNYKRISDDDLYRHSSQYRIWSFTKDNLRERRQQTNQRAIALINEKLGKFIEEKKSTLTEDELQTLRAKASPLSMEEEFQLINFYSKKVQVIAQHLNLPTEVIATSITFFRRFFLDNSVMEFDPKNLVHTTIFLACKSENYFISVDSFAKKAKSNREAILKYEFKLVESLKFSLLNHHPYKPLHGFFLDIQTILYGKVDLKYMGQIYDRCKKKITDALLTDIVYLFTPPQITLAIILMEDEQLISRYLEMKFGKDITNNTEDEKKEENKDVNETKPGKTEDKTKTPNDIELDKLLVVIGQCVDVLEKSESVTTEDAKRVAAKNYYCQNPSILLQKLKRKLEASGDDNGSESPSKKPKVEQ
ncbi:similar to Saccharomyces cerevisiae YPR025C CCL1 Cyclin associated with protein kinase Kin28p [Maudiozyma barnettii]|uniref:Similar to Saccharomyces cerevisiae YPR025C CCL1 Cyclin associated with protein kinase Kin28p n=1 Tax=Maudiozyma barnettii TaxID=61262 RepID=A0A8H2VBB8_9SACH|nr:TFIIH complex kinase subunit CCL1 [Kazachstania barnettii]CAB4252143.1 similar to Saccharomyces cerevisiae YPR025C CCL1 Cyclin associated with protein kinase Kin28p [Kazachstania barnettii]CAD1778703.1 similar to Saccharomyces cerevisiae YPR025C CCL1 Cyclin associated with protein kinase Kin28p [Kazachstania barnettii]